jgi:nitrogen fixation protein
MSRRRRWIVALVVLLALGVGASLLLRHLTRPELLARLLVQQIEQRTGLILSIGAEPDIRLLPRLSLALDDVELRLASGEMLLSADSLEMALPWRALREPVVSLDSLLLRGALIDLDTLWQLNLGAEPEGPPPPLRLPPFATHLRLLDSRVVSPARGFSLENLQVDSSPLVESSTWRLNVRGRVHSSERDAPHGFTFDLATVPRHTAGGLRLGDFSAKLERGGDPPLQAQLSGVIDLAPPRTGGEVVLTLARWPRELPDLPLDGDLTAPVELALRWDAFGLGPGDASFRLNRDDLSVEGEARFGDVVGWLTAGSIAVGPGGAGGLPPAPPIRGALRMPRLQLEDLELEGIELILRDDTAADQP